MQLDTAEFAAIQEFLQSGQADYFEAQNLSALKEQLLDIGVMVADEEDEFARIREAYTAPSPHERCLALTIIPTLDCNFRCGYCFSYMNKTRMGAAVQQRLLSFVEERLPQVDSLSGKRRKTPALS